MKNIVTMIAAMAAFGFSLAAHAAEWKQIGKGTYSVMFIDAYDITLTSPNGNYDPNAPHALAIKYRMDFSAEDINDRSIDEMERDNGLSNSERNRFASELAKVMPNVKEGDVIRAQFTPGEKTDFFKNGKPIGTVKDAAFTEKFSAIWLAENTNAPGLRNDLLAK